MLTLHGSEEPRRGSALRELGIIPDGALLIGNGKIEEVGPSRRVENLAPARDAFEIDASGKVVMPGFVDSHTHLVYGVPWLKEYENRAAQLGGDVFERTSLRASVQAVHTVSARRLEWRAQTTVAGMVRHGTTTLEAKSGYGLDQSGEVKILRVLAALDGQPLDVFATLLAALDIQGEYRRNTWDYLSWFSTTLMPKVRHRRLASFVDVITDGGGLTLEQAERYLEIARELGFLIKVHADQFRRTGSVPLAVRVGAVSVDHLDHSSPEDIDMVARSGTIATLLPGAAFHLGHGRYPPARALIDAGAAVALASNLNPETCPTYNMQMILSLACTQMHMTPAEAISAATVNGAHALRCAGRAGSFEPGKQADVLVMNASDYREIPYHFGVNAVAMTIKRGVAIYDEGKVHWGRQR